MLRLNQGSKVVTGIAVQGCFKYSGKSIWLSIWKEVVRVKRNVLTTEGQVGSHGPQEAQMALLPADPVGWTTALDKAHLGTHRMVPKPVRSSSQHRLPQRDYQPRTKPLPQCWSSQSSEGTPSGEAPRTKRNVTRTGHPKLPVGRINMIGRSANCRDDLC